MDNLGFFRRPFDTKTVTILRRFYILFSVAALIAFAVNRISYVWEQDFIFRTKIVLLRRDVQHIPDTIFCFTNVTNAINVTVAYKDDDMDYKVFVLKDPSIPPGYKLESMCDYKVYDTMAVFWMKSHITKLRKRDSFTRAIRFNISGNTSIQFTLIPHGENPYQELEPIPETTGLENVYDDMINTHYAQPNTTTYITIAPRVLSYLRDDFLGFFNVHNKTTETVVTTTVEDLNTPGVTEFQLMIPTSWELSDELLLLSIPEAFASWGGVFSLVVALFYLLFGKGRPSPFGFVQTYLMGKSTKRKIQEVYNKDKGGADFNGDNKKGPEFSSTTLRNVTTEAPSDKEIEGLEKDQQQDLNLLRDFVRVEIEVYLEMHHRLMKDMFLNMSLVDDALKPSSSKWP